MSQRVMRALLAALVGVGVLGVGSDVPVTAAVASSPPDRAELPEVTAAFEERKDRYLEAMEASPSRYFDHDAAIGLLLLEQAQRTGDHGEVPRANELVLSSTRQIEASLGTNELSAQHGAAFTFLRLVLQFGDDPDLLYPETAAAIVRGEYPDGSVEPERSLLAYRDQFFAAGYDAENVGLDVRSGEPWDPATYDEYNGTENHKLQSVVTGMLLAEVYADDVVGEVPVKNDTDDLDDQWHYFRDAFFRYSMEWADGGADHFTRDVIQTEADSSQYLPTHLGDYLLVRDLHSDPVVTAHAEVFIDRILADWVEDLVGPAHTGVTERVSVVDLDDGLSFQQHVINYLLFGMFEPAFRAASGNPLFRFGGWADLAVATTDYVPGSPDFPMVLVDIATDKGDGYTVREGGTDHNWVEQDLALGFRLDGRLFAEDMAGGLYAIAGGGGGATARLVTVFHGDTPFSKDKPGVSPSGVQAERAAVLATEAQGDPARLWVHPGFDTVEIDGRWLFAEEGTSDRTVYLAIGASSGEVTPAGSVDGGDVFEIGSGVPAVWQVATSDEVADLDEFRRRMEDAELSVDDGAVDYVSPFSGVALHFEADPAARTIDGEPVDWSAYQNSFSTPWGAHRYGTTAARIERDGQSVEWDWDPAGDGTYQAEPIKRVVNADG